MATWSSKEIIIILRAHGWYQVASKGSHVQFKHPRRAGLITVPHPKRDLPAGTVRAIFRQAGWR